MRVSELILFLQNAQEDWGDIEVKHSLAGAGETVLTEEWIEVSNEYFIQFETEMVGDKRILITHPLWTEIERIEMRARWKREKALA